MYQTYVICMVFKFMHCYLKFKILLKWSLMGSHGSPYKYGCLWVWYLMDMVFNGHGHYLTTNCKWTNGYGLMDMGFPI